MAHQENQEMLGNLERALEPMVLRLRDEETREHALYSLADHIRQLVANQDVDMYSATSLYLYKYDRTMSILEEEATRYVTQLEDLSITEGSHQCLMNILDIFKCLAIGDVKPDIVQNGYFNHLPRMIAFSDKTVKEEIREDIRENALHVVYFLCQTKEPKVVWWMRSNDRIDCIVDGIRHGSQCSKRHGTRILEVLLEVQGVLLYVCSPQNPRLLESLISTWDKMTFYAFTRKAPAGFALPHIFRCYRLLCTNQNGLVALRNESASLNLMRAFAHPILRCQPQIIPPLEKVLQSLQRLD